MSKPSHTALHPSIGKPGSKIFSESFELLAWRCRTGSEQVNVLSTEAVLLALSEVAMVIVVVRTLPLLGGGGAPAAMLMVALVAGLGGAGWWLWRNVKRIRTLRREVTETTFQIEGPEDEW